MPGPALLLRAVASARRLTASHPCRAASGGRPEHRAPPARAPAPRRPRPPAPTPRIPRTTAMAAAGDTSPTSYTYQWPRPGVTVDVALVDPAPSPPRLLLIQRARPPGAGRWALPGGFVDVDEPLGDAAARELSEETGFDVADAGVALAQVGAFGDPKRDPRGWCITIAFAGLLPAGAAAAVAGADDAADARWFALDALPPLAFDHKLIVSGRYRGLRRVEGGREGKAGGAWWATHVRARPCPFNPPLTLFSPGAHRLGAFGGRPRPGGRPPAAGTGRGRAGGGPACRRGRACGRLGADARVRAGVEGRRRLKCLIVFIAHMGDACCRTTRTGQRGSAP